MARTSKKPEFKFDRLNERAASEFIPVVNDDPSANRAWLPLEAILPRPGGDARAINANHVDALAESIVILGLITPLTVDQQGRLLAGGHRQAALQKIAAEQPDVFSALFPLGVPVHRVEIDAATDSVSALQIEVEENTQRRNFTAAEIREAAKRLESAGYEKLRGRPKAGQKSLKRELASVFRLSEDRIQRILNESEQKGRCTPTFCLESMIASLEKWIDELAERDEPEWVKTKTQMEKLLRQLKRLSVSP